MDRINDPSAPNGVFTDGDDLGGLEGSIVSALWAMGVQEELIGFFADAGFRPSSTDNTLVRQAASTVGRRDAVFTASATWTVPRGVYRVRVHVWGGGGGGGGCYGAGSAGSGGGGGGYARGSFIVTPGASIAVIVGGGGSAGGNTSTPTNGGAGGASSFGAMLSATGGGGGRCSQRGRPVDHRRGRNRSRRRLYASRHAGRVWVLDLCWRDGLRHRRRRARIVQHSSFGRHRSRIDVRGEDLRPEDHGQHPAGRVGRPEDIAAIAAFLLGPESGFVTGAEFLADGGMTRKMIYAE